MGCEAKRTDGIENENIGEIMKDYTVELIIATERRINQ